MANIQAIVFDLYGTLIYLANETKPYAKLFRGIGLQTPDDLRQARRIALSENFDNLSDFANIIKPNSQVDFNAYQQELEKELASASLYPETLNVLTQLKEQGVKLGLISNLATPYKNPFFNLGLGEYFDEVLFSCDVGLRKPNPRIYQKMLEKLTITPSHALMTGDRMHADVDGPKSVGMNAVHLDRANISSNSISSLEGLFQYT
jgi:HAD superfamily hydrolase (TIGR01509 family)